MHLREDVLRSIPRDIVLSLRAFPLGWQGAIEGAEGHIQIYCLGDATNRAYREAVEREFLKFLPQERFTFTQLLDAGGRDFFERMVQIRYHLGAADDLNDAGSDAVGCSICNRGGLVPRLRGTTGAVVCVQCLDAGEPGRRRIPECCILCGSAEVAWILSSQAACSLCVAMARKVLGSEPTDADG